MGPGPSLGAGLGGGGGGGGGVEPHGLGPEKELNLGGLHILISPRLRLRWVFREAY